MASIDGPRPLWQPAISLLYSVLYCLYFVLAINSVFVLIIGINEDMVIKYLLKLKESKAPGDDGLHPKLLKKIATEITKLLCAIFHKSLDDSEVPEDWRSANITPVFNKKAVLSQGSSVPQPFVTV